MAFLDIKNVRTAGISAGVPKKTISNLYAEEQISENYTNAEYVATTGVVERRASKHLTTSDLCYEAAERLISDLGWDKNEIGAIIFVSQTLDYILPATACIMQDRLGLGKECFCEDVQLGCSGWVYGLATLAGIMQSGTIKKGLLMAGDAKGHVDTRFKDPLFGHAGTVTALEYKEGDGGFKFHFGTDGSGYDAIITPGGGSRVPFDKHSFDEEEIDGRKYNALTTRMKGMDVFSFGISTAPKSIKKLAANSNLDLDTTDYFIFHQANKKMNDMISKKLKLPTERVPISMDTFGNTSSASIPLTMVSRIKDELSSGEKNLICCGFGVGLSWGTVAFRSSDLVISDLVEVE